VTRDNRSRPDADALSHELRTPLSVIAGYAELLAIRDDDETRHEAAARISEAVARLGTLVDELAERVAGHDRDAEPEVEQQVREARDRLGRQKEGAGPSRRVLIVDDDASLRHLVRMTLPSEGFDILEAHDGADALEQIRIRVPDIVVLDWNMPERSGSAVLGELQTSHPDLPVIVLTAEHRPSHKALAGALGARTFLTKPFSPLELLATIEALLEEPPRRRGRWTN
jgi:CheY-like chemotaxis protein